ncbi:MAG TPA: hypothetical protein VKS22_17065 [Candidatus Binataceae bacterium]|nr:hypothetical protein [Candidatus Binataceae bacterium]
MQELQPILASLGRGAEAFAQRALYGSPADMIAQLEPYIARGLDKFVLWPVAEPEAWANQVELIGREVRDPLHPPPPAPLALSDRSVASWQAVYTRPRIAPVGNAGVAPSL